ncbi:hypothetical protein UFOVP1090_38 [uncultured Caudovirales phage]|uniref:Uncharacterized protein n=1 Tax=uncultured Caudovirales phage TaxID=2100421 RepID=A0A6J5QPH7_9CAUD|nr:hypothetical protein UFOVP1090_38 [uncultured Caudovirales phage]
MHKQDQQPLRAVNSYPLQQQQKGGDGTVTAPKPPPKQGQTAVTAAATTASATRNTGRRSTVVGQGAPGDNLGDRIKNLLGG